MVNIYTKDRIWQQSVNKSSDAVEWVLSVGDTFAPNFKVGFDIGDEFPLTLNVSTGIDLRLKWNLQLGFGYSLQYLIHNTTLFNLDLTSLDMDSI